jgi:hypothetical protein
MGLLLVMTGDGIIPHNDQDGIIPGNNLDGIIPDNDRVWDYS